VRLAFLLFLILIGDLTMLVGAVRCDSYFHALRRAAGFVLGCLGGRSAKILQRARGPSGPARLRTAAAVGALPPRGRDGGRFAGRTLGASTKLHENRDIICFDKLVIILTKVSRDQYQVYKDTRTSTTTDSESSRRTSAAPIGSLASHARVARFSLDES
jgi:hypothetical protein